VLIPLIKFLHPDLMAHHTEEIKIKNMTCIQNLNDLWDTIENNTENERLALASINIRTPFRPSYDLSCYLKPIEGKIPKKKAATGVEELESNSFVLKVPEILCKRQAVSNTIFLNSMDSILMQQGQLFSLAGLEDPWIAERAAPEAAPSESNNPYLDKDDDKIKNRSSLSEEQLTDLDIRVFERMVIKNHEMSASEGSSYKKLFNNHAKRPMIIESALFGRTYSKEGQVVINQDQVDTYFHKGNVKLLPPISAAEEFEALKNLRQFLTDFANVINFNAFGWRRVVIMLHSWSGAQFVPADGSRKDRKRLKAAAAEAAAAAAASRLHLMGSGERRRHKRRMRGDRTVSYTLDNNGYADVDVDADAESESDGVGAHGHGGGGEAGPSSRSSGHIVPDGGVRDGDGNLGTVSNGGYSVEYVGDHQYIVRIPTNFKERHLLEFLGQHLPPSKLKVLQPKE
jgi:hypothetical protein